MKISKHGLDFIKGFESFVPYLYDDKRYSGKAKYGYAEYDGSIPLKGTLTIGYGHTKDAIAKVNMGLGARLTEEEACRILDEDLDEIEGWINKNVKVKLTQGQFDALVSFGFNCGTGNLAKLVRPLNQGDYQTTRAKFDEFIRSGGEVMRGLQRRRDGEQELWDATYGEAPEQAPTKLPEATVDHPADVDTPTTPVSTFEKVATTAGPLLSGGSAIFGDWKVTLIIAVTFVVLAAGYLLYRKHN